MATQFVPDGFHTVTPYLTVQGIDMAYLHKYPFQGSQEWMPSRREIKTCTISHFFCNSFDGFVISTKMH